MKHGDYNYFDLLILKKKVYNIYFDETMNVCFDLIGFACTQNMTATCMQFNNIKWTQSRWILGAEKGTGAV